MKKIIRVAFAALALALLTGCPEITRGGEGTKTGEVKGKITCSAAGNNEGINVFLEATDGLRTISTARSLNTQFRAAAAGETSFVTKTDANGNYSISDVPAGLYTLYAATNNSTQKAVSTNVNVVAGNITTVKDLLLTGTGSINGKVLIDGTETGNLGVTVFIPQTSYSAKTDDAGNFKIDNVPEGTYTLAVQKDLCTKMWTRVSPVVKTGETFAAGTFTSITSAEILLGYKDGEDGKDGISIIWLGSFADSAEILEPSKMNAFYNTTDGCSYIYTGTEWVLLAKAGGDGEDGEDSSSNQYLSVTPTSKGIVFVGGAPETNNGFYVNIKELENDITMQKYISTQYYTPYDWEMIYPLVEAGKTYEFEVKVFYQDWIYYKQNITVTATGGLGEYKLLNKDENQLVLTDDKVLKSTQPPVFSENPNVSVNEVYIHYYLGRSLDDDTAVFDCYWIGEPDVHSEDDNYALPLKDLGSYYFYDFDYINNSLCGNNYYFYAYTVLKLNGFLGDNDILFFMNDYRYAKGSWGGEKYKTAVLYGVDFSSLNNSYTDISIDEAEQYVSLQNMPGELKTVIINGVEKTYYVEFYNGSNIIREPLINPVITEILYPEYSNYNAAFKGWTYTGGSTISYSNSLYNLAEIDGEQYIIKYNNAKFKLDYRFTVTYKLSEDPAEPVYKIFIADSRNNNYNPDLVPLPVLPEKENKLFVGWYVYMDDGNGLLRKAEITDFDNFNGIVRKAAAVNNWEAALYANYISVADITDTAAAGSDTTKYTSVDFEGSIVTYAFNLEAGKKYCIEWVDLNNPGEFNDLTRCCWTMDNGSEPCNSSITGIYDASKSGVHRFKIKPSIYDETGGKCAFHIYEVTE